MTGDQEDFFGAGDEYGGLVRDRYDRPMLIPATGGDREPYTRASSFASRVENQYHIHRWQQRYLARAMADNPDLSILASGEVYTTGYDMADEDENKASGRRLDDIVERALDRMGIHQKADFGTAVHSFVTPLEQHPNPVPKTPDAYPDMQAHITGYRNELDKRGIAVISSEQFVACDALQAAGTYDGVYHEPDFGFVIGDVKTGKNKVGFAVQASIYANGVHYDPETDKRTPIHPELNREVGLLFYVTDKGTKVKKVDLVLAYEMAHHIKRIIDDFKISALITDLDAPPELTLLDRIGQTRSIDELRDLWHHTQTDWGDEHIAAANLQRGFFS